MSGNSDPVNLARSEPPAGPKGPTAIERLSDIVAGIVSRIQMLERAPIARDGRDGMIGRDGKDGVQGPEGKRGEAGPQGQAGERGPEGDVGRDGRDGRGITGVAILEGKLVLTFSDGSEAVAGNVVGPAGPAGPAGEPGPRGAAGEVGPAGDRGLQGLTGARGPDGKPGRDGKDATLLSNVVNGPSIEIGEPYEADVRDLKDVARLVARDLTINGETFQVLCRS